MTEPYKNYVEWKPEPTGSEMFHEAMKRRAISGLEVTEATQEEYEAAKHAFVNKYLRNVGD